MAENARAVLAGAAVAAVAAAGAIALGAGADASSTRPVDQQVSKSASNDAQHSHEQAHQEHKSTSASPSLVEEQESRAPDVPARLGLARCVADVIRRSLPAASVSEARTAESGLGMIAAQDATGAVGSAGGRFIVVGGTEQALGEQLSGARSLLRSGRKAVLVVAARAGEQDAFAALRALARQREQRELAARTKAKGKQADGANPASRAGRKAAQKAAVEAALPESVRAASVTDARLPLKSEAGRSKALAALALQFGSAFVGAAALVAAEPVPSAAAPEGGESHLVELARRAGSFEGPAVLVVLAGASAGAEGAVEDHAAEGTSQGTSAGGDGATLVSSAGGSRGPFGGAVGALVTSGAWPLFAWDPRREGTPDGALEVHSSHVSAQLRAFAEQETVLSLMTRRSGAEVGQGAGAGGSGSAPGS